MPLALVLFEPVRSAEPPMSSGIAPTRRRAHSARRAWRAWACPAISFAFMRRLRRRTRRQLAGLARSNSARSSEGRRASALQPGARVGAAAAGLRQRSSDVDRDLEGTVRSSRACALAGDFAGAERRAVRARGAGLGRRAVADDGAAGDQRRGDRSRAAAIAAAISAGSWPSTRVVPSRGGEALRTGRRRSTATSGRRSRSDCRRTAR
jgi:hypothetical protein